MLCQFSVSNFGCIKDEVTLDMQATALTEHKDSLFTDIDGERFLPLAVIYGPNGAGKSTILTALHSLISRIMKPICATTASCERGEQCLKKSAIIAELPFLFSKETKDAPTKYEIFFRTQQYEYQYNLHTKRNKVTYEKLQKKCLTGERYALVFERNDQITLKGSMRKYEVSDISESIPMLSYLIITHGRNAILKDIREWLEVGIDFLNFGNPDREQKIWITDDPTIKRIILNMLAEMDIDIIDYSIDRDENDRIKHIYTTHKVGETEYQLELLLESSGTIKLFNLIPDIAMSLRYGTSLVVDELDAKLHPALLKYIISLYSNKESNKHNAQMIFTSHDISTMTNEVFRRDEIWFVAKSHEQSANLYSLVEFKLEDGTKPRKDASINKQYLEGRYGADPYLRRIIDWSDTE